MPFDNEKGKELLFKLDDIFQYLGIPFFLLQGTALGAYRDKGFVANEGDIDIGILIENFESSVILSWLNEKGIEVETWHRMLPFNFCHTIVAYTPGWPYKLGAKVDIVGLHRWKYKRFTCTPYDPKEVLHPYCIVHEASLLENYEEIELFGRKFNIPSPIETYLAREYGILDWKIPKKDSMSRTRVYDYFGKEQMPHEFFNAQPQSVSTRTG